MIDLNKLAAELHEAAVEKGFWDVEDAVEKHIAKMHSELSEAVQADRADIMYEVERNGAKPEGVVAELADFVMMALDYLVQTDVTITDELSAKFEELANVPEAQNAAKACKLPQLVNSLHHAVCDAQNDDISMLLGGLVFIHAWMSLRDYDLWEIIRTKMEYNQKSRAYLHGRKY